MRLKVHMHHFEFLIRDIRVNIRSQDEWVFVLQNFYPCSYSFFQIEFTRKVSTLRYLTSIQLFRNITFSLGSVFFFWEIFFHFELEYEKTEFCHVDIFKKSLKKMQLIVFNVLMF